MTIGPIQAFVVGFPSNDLFEGRIADELARLSEIGQIRIVDAVFVIREGDDIAAVSVSALDDDQRAELRAAVGALVGLGVAGADGAVAGAEAGATSDVEGASASEVIAAAILDELPAGQLGARARDRAPVGRAAPRCRAGRRWHRARPRDAHPGEPDRPRHVPRDEADDGD